MNTATEKRPEESKTPKKSLRRSRKERLFRARLRRAECASGALTTRALTALGHALEVLPDRARDSLLEESDAGLLATLASALGTAVSDPLAAAKARAVRARAELVDAADGLLDTKAVAERLAVTPQAINKQLHQGKLLAVTRGGNALAFPACQFDAEGEPLEGLPEVLEVLRRKAFGSWTQLRFLAGRNGRLRNRTPIEAMRAGDLPSVLRAAEAFEEHGAD